MDLLKKNNIDEIFAGKDPFSLLRTPNNKHFVKYPYDIAKIYGKAPFVLKNFKNCFLLWELGLSSNTSKL